MARQYCLYCMSPLREGPPCPACGQTGSAYSPASHQIPPGSVLAGRYLVGRVLGEGGFGITYLGCDLRLELRVAIKEYYPVDRVSRSSARSLRVEKHSGCLGESFEAGRERFVQEAQVMARIDKMPQIVSVRDFFQENNTAYIVMEYVDGTTLKELVARRGGKMSAGELLPLVEPLFPALSAMHALDLIHRDISPDNLMLDKGGVRLLDFGCVREAAQGKNSMTVVLKQGYSPIEQYQHKGQGPWTDIYSLAATLYYCLTGTTPPQALDRICDEELTPPRQLGADVTPAQERAILRGMGLRRSQRYATAEEFHAALYQGADTPPEPAMPGDVTVALEPEPAPVMPGELTVPLEPKNIPVTPEPEPAPAMPGDLTVPFEPELEYPPEPPEPAGDKAGQPLETARQDGNNRRRERLGIVGGIAALALLLALLVWFLGGRLSMADTPPEASAGMGNTLFLSAEKQGPLAGNCAAGPGRRQ